MNFKKMMVTYCFCLSNFIGFCQSQFVIQSGTEIKLSANNYVVLENTHLLNNGIFNLNSGNGTFKFSGNTNSNISGSNLPLFNNVELAKIGSAQLILQRDIDVWGSLVFTSGLLHLNNRVLDLGKFGFLTNENETSHVVGPTGGYLQWSDVLNAPSAVNPGNLGVVITTTQNLGTTTIRRAHVSQTNGAGAGSSVLRYFDIIPANNTALNATLRLIYLDAELNGLSEPSLTLWKSIDLTSWNNLGSDSRNATTNYVEKNSISDFSRWTLSSPGNALPVHFGVFNTKCHGAGVTVRWTTESETDSKFFEVQKSDDGRKWITVSNLPAAGNSSNTHQYSFTDQTAVHNNFYRIAEVDINGRFNYSAISRISCGTDTEFKLWPNPAATQAWLSLTSSFDESASLRITDQKGRLVYYKQVQLFAGNNTVNMDTWLLPAGTYLVEMIMHQKIKSAKLIKL